MMIQDQSILDRFGDEYHGMPLTLKALDQHQWLMVLQCPPSCRLRLSAESDLTKTLDSMGLSDEVKIGHPQLDEAYVIRADSPQAKTLLQNSAVQALLSQLSPFQELELTQNEYRLIQEVPSAKLEASLTLLAQLVDLTRLS